MQNLSHTTFLTGSGCRWLLDGHTCPASPCLAQIWASGTHSQCSRHLHLWFLQIQLSWACIPGVQTLLALTCHTWVPQTHIFHIPIPLVHNHVLFYFCPTVLEFQVLLVVVKVRGGQVVNVIIVLNTELNSSHIMCGILTHFLMRNKQRWSGVRVGFSTFPKVRVLNQQLQRCLQMSLRWG